MQDLPVAILCLPEDTAFATAFVVVGGAGGGEAATGPNELAAADAAAEAAAPLDWPVRAMACATVDDEAPEDLACTARRVYSLQRSKSRFVAMDLLRAAGCYTCAKAAAYALVCPAD